MTALKLPLGMTFVEHVSHNAFPPSPGQGDQFPEPPFHVDVVCARAGTPTSPTNARAVTAIRNRKLTNFVTSLDESISIQPPSLISVCRSLQTCLPGLEAQAPRSYCITYCTLVKTSDGEVPIMGVQPAAASLAKRICVPADTARVSGPESAKLWFWPRSSWMMFVFAAGL